MAFGSVLSPLLYEAVAFFELAFLLHHPCGPFPASAGLQVEFVRRHPKVEPYAPPDPMGLGRDEDTIGNVRSLVPKQPQPDQEKLALCVVPPVSFLSLLGCVLLATNKSACAMGLLTSSVI